MFLKLYKFNLRVFTIGPFLENFVSVQPVKDITGSIILRKELSNNVMVEYTRERNFAFALEIESSVSCNWIFENHRELSSDQLL